MQICDHWYTDPTRFHFWHLRLPMRASTALHGSTIKVSKVLNFNGDSDGVFTIRILLNIKQIRICNPPQCIPVHTCETRNLGKQTFKQIKINLIKKLPKKKLRIIRWYGVLNKFFKQINNIGERKLVVSNHLLKNSTPLAVAFPRSTQSEKETLLVPYHYFIYVFPPIFTFAHVSGSDI